MARAKDPAAVALGKKRQAQMTADERAQLRLALAASNASRSPAEKRRIARKAAMTRRRRPKWMSSNAVETQEVSIERPATAGELAQLAGVIDRLSDEELERIAAALAGL
jgi:hypothetical protein